jgi:hypothetical protein
MKEQVKRNFTVGIYVWSSKLLTETLQSLGVIGKGKWLALHLMQGGG